MRLPTRANPSSRVGAFLFLAAWASLLVFQIRFFLSAEPVQLTVVPDDGFYYLQPARHFFKLGLWSFDQGVSLTSGFHLAWAYLLALLSLAFKAPAALFLAATALGALLTHALAGALWRSSRQDEPALYVGAALLASVNVAWNSVSLMEWPLLPLIAGAYALQLWHAEKPRAAAGLFALGLAGSLARSDFGLFPGCLALGALLQARFGGDRRLLKPSLWGLAGASLGVLLVLLHSRAFTGAWIQGSAQTKLFWAQSEGISVLMALRVLAHFLTGIYPDISLRGPQGLSLALGLLILGGGSAWALWRLRPGFRALGARAELLVGASLATLAGYHLLYCLDGAVQLWYSANQAVPTGLLLYFSLRALPSASVRSWLLGSLAVLALWNIAWTQARPRGIASQVAQSRAGQALREAGAPGPGRMGSWNAGILSYYQGGSLVNLDGLVNNDVLPYLRRGRLDCYLAQKDIRWIVDFDIFTSRFAPKLGIGDGCVQRAIRHRRVLGQSDDMAHAVFLFELDPIALQACCEAGSRTTQP